MCGDGVGTNKPTEIWAGFEQYESSDQQGGPSPNPIHIGQIGYRNGGANFTYVIDTTIQHCCGADESYWIENSGTTSNLAWIEAYTLSHWARV